MMRLAGFAQAPAANKTFSTAAVRPPFLLALS
jgi:hypothetical protein